MIRLRDNIIGWYGTTAIIVSYFLLSMGIIGPGVIYQSLSLSGALAIIWITFLQKARQSMVLNIIWAMIAIVALIKLSL